VGKKKKKSRGVGTALGEKKKKGAKKLTLGIATVLAIRCTNKLTMRKGENSWFPGGKKKTFNKESGTGGKGGGQKEGTRTQNHPGLRGSGRKSLDHWTMNLFLFLQERMERG